MKVEVSQVIDRPVSTVFRFYAHDHVRNHPRWDPMMELEQVSDGPIGVGTVIRRRNTHFGDPVEGTMEVTEFDENHAMGVVIHDGDTETLGRVVCEPLSSDQTRILISAGHAMARRSGCVVQAGRDDPRNCRQHQGTSRIRNVKHWHLGASR